MPPELDASSGRSDSAPIIVHIGGDGIAWVRMNRPKVGNAVNVALAEALRQAVAQTEADDSVQVVILGSTTPGIFSAGADLSAVIAGQLPQMFLADGGFAGFVRTNRSKPWIAMIDGYALGGGLEIALACDLLIASTRSRFAMPEVGRGLVAMAGGVQRLPWRLPPQVAMDMILTGEPIDAERAYQLGLASRIVAPDNLPELALAVAHAICGNAPGAVRDSLALVKHAIESGELATWDLTPEAEQRRLSSPEIAEGIRAFLEKRAPCWRLSGPTETAAGKPP